MRVSFRQGVLSAPSPYFNGILSVGSIVPEQNKVNLDTTSGDVRLTISHGTSEYLFIEPKQGINTNAWIGPFIVGINYWLYWDINPATGIRTFGSTTLQPIVSTTAPNSPGVNQHWFDTTAHIMNVWNGATWKIVIRLFACELISGTVLSPGVAGPNGFVVNVGVSQVGTSGQYNSGRILFDDQGKGIKKSTGSFMTTEETFFAPGTSVHATKLENNVMSVIAAAPMSGYTVVKLTSFDIVSAADYFDVGTQLLGIIINDVNANDLTEIVMQGIISNSLWNWSAPGIPLYVTTDGVLVENDPQPVSIPVGRVVNQTTIWFEQVML